MQGFKNHLHQGLLAVALHGFGFELHGGGFGGTDRFDGFGFGLTDKPNLLRISLGQKHLRLLLPLSNQFSLLRVILCRLPLSRLKLLLPPNNLSLLHLNLLSSLNNVDLQLSLPNNLLLFGLLQIVSQSGLSLSLVDFSLTFSFTSLVQFFSVVDIGFRLHLSVGAVLVALGLLDFGVAVS